MDSPRKMVRLQVVLPWIVFGVVVGVSMLIVTLNYLAVTPSFEEMARSVMTRVGRETAVSTNTFMNTAAQAVKLTRDLLDLGNGQSLDKEPFNRITRPQLMLNPHFSLLYVGDHHGNSWLNKHETDGTIRTRLLKRLVDTPESHRAVSEAMTMPTVTREDKEAVAKRIAPYLKTIWHYQDERGRFTRQEAAPYFAFDPRLRPWYQGAVKKGGLFWTDVYSWAGYHRNKFYTQVGITASIPVKKEETLLGVVGVDIVLKDISKFLAEQHVTENGRAFLVQTNGLMVASADYNQTVRSIGNGKIERMPIQELEDTAITASFKAAREAMGLGSGEEMDLAGEKLFTYSVEGSRYYGFFRSLDSEYALPWIVGVVVPEDDFLQHVKQQLYRGIGLALFLALAVGLITMMLSRLVTRPINELALATEKVGELDLKGSSKVSSVFQELDFITEKFTEMHANLYFVVRQMVDMVISLQDASTDMSQASSSMFTDIDTVKNLSDQTAGSASTVNENMRSVDASVEEMSLNLHNSSEMIREIDQKAESIHATTRELLNNAREMVTQLDNNVRNVETIMDATRNNNQEWGSISTVLGEFQESVATLSELGKNAKEETRQANDRARERGDVTDKLTVAARDIDQVVKAIGSIAGQTNMLALNASIEAASAGEAGKGFSVVANEVKALANQTAEATQQISTKVGEVQQIANEVAEFFQDMVNSLGSIDDTNENIFQALDGFEAKFGAITRSLDNLDTNSNQVTERLESFSRETRKDSERLHTISSSIQEIDDHIAKVSERMNGLSADLNQVANANDAILGKVSNVSVSMNDVTTDMKNLKDAANRMGEASSKVSYQTEKISDISRDLEGLASRFMV